MIVVGHCGNGNLQLIADVFSDGRSAGHGVGGAGNTGYSSGTGIGTGTGTNTGYGSTGTSTTSGPHSSNLANKADPRVDSDRGKRLGSLRCKSSDVL